MKEIYKKNKYIKIPMFYFGLLQEYFNEELYLEIESKNYKRIPIYQNDLIFNIENMIFTITKKFENPLYKIDNLNSWWENVQYLGLFDSITKGKLKMYRPFKDSYIIYPSNILNVSMILNLENGRDL